MKKEDIEKIILDVGLCSYCRSYNHPKDMAQKLFEAIQTQRIRDLEELKVKVTENLMPPYRYLPPIGREELNNRVDQKIERIKNERIND
jgi:hypothetical protein